MPSNVGGQELFLHFSRLALIADSRDPMHREGKKGRPSAEWLGVSPVPSASLSQRDGLRYIGAIVWKSWGLSAAAQANVSANCCCMGTYLSISHKICRGVLPRREKANLGMGGPRCPCADAPAAEAALRNDQQQIDWHERQNVPEVWAVS